MNKPLLVLLCLVSFSYCSGIKDVTCGSIIKLKHKTGFYLHSHEVKYGTGSHQQSVTCFPEATDSNSYWIVEAGLGNPPCSASEPIPCNSRIRLLHLNTKKRLHSHLFTSPLSGQQEVSCFDGLDTGDNWIIECDAKSGPTWRRDRAIRLRHEDTNNYLHSHDVSYNAPIHGQREVTCYQTKKDSNNLWKAEEGIYFGSWGSDEGEDGEEADDDL
ncbi:hypothetical protein RCL1_008609 [Eukaryota sp. TZLM3-RCL]